MKFEVITVSEEEFAGAVPMPPANAAQQDYADVIIPVLESADSKEVLFQSVSAGEKTSDTFQKAMWVEDVISKYINNNSRPEAVKILCLDENVCETYKVVYNFYYASTKSERLEDEKWD